MKTIYAEDRKKIQELCLSGKSLEEVAKIYNVTPGALRRHIKEIKHLLPINRKVTEEESNFLHENFPSKGIKYCKQYVDLTEKQIQGFCSRNKIETLTERKKKSREEAKLARSKTFDEKVKSDNFKVKSPQFIKDFTPHTAYILGLAWADGWIQGNSLSVQIVEEDMSTIKWVFDATGDWNLYTRLSKIGNKTQLCLNTTNKNITDFLKSNDYLNKSYESADKILSFTR